MSSRTKKMAAAVLVMALLLIGVVGAAQAQTPDPANPDATPNRLQQMQERLGPDGWAQMIQRMTQRHGAEEAGKMLQRMASEEGTGEGHAGMMGGRGMMGRSGRGMGGFWQGMGSWH